VLNPVEWIVLGGVGVVAIIVGIRRHQPARAGPWLLLAGSVAALAAGDVCLALGDHGATDVLYPAMFAMSGLGLLQLTRGGALLVDRAHVIDLLSATCSGLLVVWAFVIGGRGRLGSLSAADLIADTVLLGVSLRLALPGRNRSAILLTVGAAAMLISDVAYPIAPNPLTRAGYVVLYVTWAASALHPSMTQLTTPSPASPAPWRGRWAALLGISVATPPLVLLIEAVSGIVRDGGAIAVACGVTLMLAITRLADSVAQHSLALSRERGLREASAALVAAADPRAVNDAVCAGIAQLMPPHTVHKVVLAEDDGQLAAEHQPPDIGPCPRSWWVRGADPDTETATLVCPLWLEPLSTARPYGGALLVTGRREQLAVGRDTLLVLAGQAALALDRISLVEAVGRRDSDLYLRAVIQNASDIMLVTDEDQRIRYASPALRAMLGSDDLPPLAVLLDLVHAGDHAEVGQALRSGGDGIVFCALERPDTSQVLVELTYRDLRGDRLVRGYVITMRDVTDCRPPDEQVPDLERVDALPARLNRRGVRHRFRQ
jgi:PAS domain S-box-containing protein